MIWKGDIENYPLNSKEDATEPPRTRESFETPQITEPVESPRVAQASQMHPPTTGTSGAVWAVLIALAVGLSGVAYYDYSTLREHNIKLAQLPSLLDSVTGASKRLDSAEAKLSAWAGDRDMLLGRVNQLQGKINANAKSLQKQTHDWVAQAQNRMQADLEKHNRVIDARLSRFESEQQADRARLAKVQDEVSTVRQEIVSVRAEQGETGQKLFSLNRQQTDSRSRLEVISNQLDRERVDFEAAKNETRELAAGVSLHILKTSVSYQRYAGWLNFLPDHRTMWIQDQGAQEPVVIRAKSGGEPYELVVTGVNKHGVTGYMLVPVSGAAAQPRKVAATENEKVEAAVRPGV